MASSYIVTGQTEQLLAIPGGDAGARILILLPLFDEMNRMRRTALLAMRRLSTSGIASAIADLPGCNESLSPLSDQTLTLWADAVARAAEQFAATHVASFRGGALIDHRPGLPVWRCAPIHGNALLRTMLRTRIAAEREAGQSVSSDALLEAGRQGPLDLGGSVLGPEMIVSLAEAEPQPVARLRTVTLAPGGHTPGPCELTGSPVWLRAEPGEDAVFAQAIADELATWVAA